MAYAKRVCEICDSTYRPTYGKQRTCSRECGGRLNAYEQTGRWPSSPLVYSHCSECGMVMVGRTAKTRCEQCPPAKFFRTSPVRAFTVRTVTVICCDCSSEFTFVQKTAPRKRCPDCTAKLERIYRKNAKHRRRARTRTGELIRSDEIFARDRYTCQLCHKRLAMTKAVPHPKAPTLDHVVPLADGGEHTRANVQAAHFECNSVKSAGGTQQLALIG